jgi:hypothetical protein
VYVSEGLALEEVAHNFFFTVVFFLYTVVCFFCLAGVVEVRSGRSYLSLSVGEGVGRCA